MNGLEIGPLVVSNDQIIAIVALVTVVLVSEIFAWRRPLEAGAIRRWTVVAALTWIVAARVGFVVRHLDHLAARRRQRIKDLSFALIDHLLCRTACVTLA